MHIEIHAPHQRGLHARIADFAAGRALRAAGRLADRVERVVLRLADLNGPKGGIDRRCLAELRLAGGGVLVVEQRAEARPAAVGQALGRIGALLHRRIGRQRSHRQV